MSRALPRWTFANIATALLVALAAQVQAQEAAQRKTNKELSADGPRAVAPDRQHVAGVIIKSEPLAKSAEGTNDNTGKGKPKGKEPAGKAASPLRLTINTAAVWRDWVRDQVGRSPGASPRADARRGEESIATKGEPRDEDTEVVVVVDASTRLATRFRLASGGSGPDGATPAEAREASEDPAARKPRDSTAAAKEKSDAQDPQVTRFQASDLKPGLFVEIDFRQEGGRNVAKTVAVIRPVEGPDIAPVESSGGEKKGRDAR